MVWQRTVGVASLVGELVLGLSFGLQTPTDTQDAAETSGEVTRDSRLWEGSGEPVTIAFAGDVHFQAPIRAQLMANPSGLLADVAPALSTADITIVNLETAITNRGTPASKAYTFRDPPEGLAALQAAGVDVVTAANNHGLDYGLAGLTDTLAAGAASGLPIIGIGMDDTQAYAPYITDVDGQRIGILAGSHVIDEALEADWTAGPGKPGMANAMIDRMDQAVRDLRAEVDTLIVYPHWGIETQQCPSDMQRRMVERMYAAGADVVVGTHTHRLLGAGFYKDMFVGYGLGNFMFYADAGPSGETGVLTVTATGRHVDDFVWQPGQITKGVPDLLTGQAATVAQEEWADLRQCTDLTAEAGGDSSAAADVSAAGGSAG